MATVSISKRNDGISSTVNGSFTSDNAAQTLALGFVPNYIIVYNETDVITWEKINGMAAANCISTAAAGTRTLNAASQILFNTDGTVTLGATLVGNAKAIKFRATL